jgi:hypothetical protein
MATVKLQSATEQNANTIAGVQIDTAVYVGTGLAGVPILRVGRDAPVYVLGGVQTAVTVNIVAEVVNAYHGAQFTIRRGTGAGSTSVLQVVNAATGGAVVATSSGVQRDTVITFNGAAWR